MQSVVVLPVETTFENDHENGRSDLEDLTECLLNLIVNSRVQSPLTENSHSTYLLDLFMTKLCQLAADAKEYFPIQRFSNKKMIHVCSDNNDQVISIANQLSIIIIILT